MSNIEEKLVDLQRLQKAAVFDSKNLIGSLTHLITFRQQLAQKLLSYNGNEEVYKELIKIYEYTEDKIKLLLAL